MLSTIILGGMSYFFNEIKLFLKDISQMWLETRHAPREMQQAAEPAPTANLHLVAYGHQQIWFNYSTKWMLWETLSGPFAKNGKNELVIDGSDDWKGKNMGRRESPG